MCKTSVGCAKLELCPAGGGMAGCCDICVVVDIVESLCSFSTVGPWTRDTLGQHRDFSPGEAIENCGKSRDERNKILFHKESIV